MQSQHSETDKFSERYPMPLDLVRDYPGADKYMNDYLWRSFVYEYWNFNRSVAGSDYQATMELETYREFWSAGAIPEEEYRAKQKEVNELRKSHSIEAEAAYAKIANYRS